MAKERNIYKEAVEEINRQLNEDVDGSECCLYIANIISDVRMFESGNADRMVYLKK